MNEIKHIQLSAGRGPAECAWVVDQLVKYLLKFCPTKAIECKVLSREKGSERRTVQSAILSLEGEQLNDFLEEWVGTIQWIGKSPFRPMHKRKNWFIGLQEVGNASSFQEVKDKDLSYQAIRSSGPGGQHVNKVSSAIRVTHLPTGLQVLASEHRSQHQNKKIAKQRLLAALEEKNVDTFLAEQKNAWENHLSLERGNAKQVFEGRKFQLK